MSTLMAQLFPLPNSADEAVPYLARIDQLHATWRDDAGAGFVLGLLEGIRAAVEATYR